MQKYQKTSRGITVALMRENYSSILGDIRKDYKSAYYK